MSANGRRADWVTATMSPNPTAPNTVTVNWMLTKNEISPTVSTTWLWISLIGNQVWLIVAAAAMFAAFPVWYATMFSGYYLACARCCCCCCCCCWSPSSSGGVAFEYRGRRDAASWRRTWDEVLMRFRRKCDRAAEVSCEHR